MCRLALGLGGLLQLGWECIDIYYTAQTCRVFAIFSVGIRFDGIQFDWLVAVLPVGISLIRLARLAQSALGSVGSVGLVDQVVRSFACHG